MALPRLMDMQRAQSCEATNDDQPRVTHKIPP